MKKKYNLDLIGVKVVEGKTTVFKQVFTNASTVPGSLITVDYSRNVTSIDAFINTIKQLNYSIDFKDYAQKSNNDNSEKSKAITYINISSNGRDIWAIGEDENIIKSSFNGIISAINRI